MQRPPPSYLLILVIVYHPQKIRLLFHALYDANATDIAYANLMQMHQNSHMRYKPNASDDAYANHANASYVA